MARIEVTPHLYRYFPQLENRSLAAAGNSVAAVLAALDAQAPGIKDYLLDERGRLRRHVNICINNAPITDRSQLSDAVAEADRVFIFQALSGG